MPVIQNAKKALRQSRKKALANKKVKRFFSIQAEKLKKDKSIKNLAEVFSAVDKMAKNNIIHPNKAGRLKSRFSKLIPVKAAPKTTKPAVASKKPASK